MSRVLATANDIAGDGSFRELDRVTVALRIGARLRVDEFERAILNAWQRIGPAVPADPAELATCLARRRTSASYSVRAAVKRNLGVRG